MPIIAPNTKDYAMVWVAVGGIADVLVALDKEYAKKKFFDHFGYSPTHMLNVPYYPRPWKG